MHRFFLFVLLVCSLAPISGQTEGTTETEPDTSQYPFIAYWGPEDTYEFQVTRIQTKEKNGETAQSDTTVYLSRFEVIDSTGEDYTIRYTFDTTLLQTRVVDASMRAAFEQPELQYIDYKTDSMGTLLHLVDWERFGKNIQTFVTDSLMRSAPEQDQEIMAGIASRLTAQFETEIGVLGNLFPELYHMHFFYGTIINSKDTLRWDDQLTVPMTGKEYPSSNTLYAQGVDWQNDYIELRHLREVTEGKLLLRDVLQQLMASLVPELEMQEVLNESAVTFVDDNYYVFYNYPGIPIYIENDRYVRLDIADEGNQLNHIKLIVEWVD